MPSKDDVTAETLDHTYPLRITPSMLKAIKTTASRRRTSDVDAARLSMGIGLEVLRQLNYDVEGSLVARFLRKALPSKSRR